jgi:hypothetical protein
MEVGAAGTASTNPLDSLGRPVTPAGEIGAVASAAVAAGLTDDRIDPFLQDIAGPQISQLLNLVEQTREAQDPRVLDAMLRKAVVAVHSHNLPGAFTAITELVTLNPERGAQIVNDSAALAPVRSEVKDLLHRLTLTARLQAEQTLSAATLAVETAPQRGGHAHGLHPQDILALARHFFDSGQHINYVRAAELAQMVLAYYPVPVAGVRSAGRSNLLNEALDSLSGAFKPAARTRPPHALHRLKALWRRAPLLILLAGWLSIGLIGAFISLLAGSASQAPVEIWATGFLVLVGFQFIVTVRNR